MPPQFSYKDFFLGFKELLLEDLSGALSVSITPGVGAAGASAPRLPQVVLKLEGGPGGEAGALLRFLGEGVSLVTRREMLGVTPMEVYPEVHRMMREAGLDPYAAVGGPMVDTGQSLKAA